MVTDIETDLWMTLVLQHTVETLGVQAAGMFICLFAVAPWDFGQVSYMHLDFPHWFVGLAKEITTPVYQLQTLTY